MTESPAPESRWSGMGDVLKRIAVGSLAAAVAVGALGAIIGISTDRTVSSMVAAAYYIVGCLLFVIGMFPTGGFSMVRGTLTRRRPTGARQEPIFLLGLVLIALGVVVDVAA